jgi:hypothetical protein
MSDWPPEDPVELGDFPWLNIGPDRVFYRLHRAEFEPGYFCNDGYCRFDPPRHSRVEYGTCYVATSPVGAFLETLGRIRPLPEGVVRDRVVSEVAPEVPVRVADLTHPSVVGRFGIAGDVSVGSDYGLPQAWGAALIQAGFAGVMYTARHDPTFTETSVAFFGPPGEQPGRLRRVKDTESGPVGDELAAHMQERFGIVVVPTMPLDL